MCSKKKGRKYMTVVFKIDLREKDVDGNKIDTQKDIDDIENAILKFWNVAGLEYKIVKETYGK